MTADFEHDSNDATLAPAVDPTLLAELAEVVATQLPAAFIVVDGHGDVVVASAAADELFGPPAGDEASLLRRYPLRRPDGECFHEAERPILAALRSGQRLTREFEICGVDGEVRRIVASASPVLRPSGDTWALGVFVDVTQLRGAEAQREALLDRVTRLQQVTSALSRDLSPDDVAGTVITQVAGAMGAWAGAAALLGDDGLLHHTGSHGYQPDVVERYRCFPLDADNLLAAAARTREAQVCGSVEEVLARHPSLRATLEATGSQALVALPLVIDRRLLGSIGFSFRERRTFDERDLAFFSALAEQCAQALDRAIAYRRVAETGALLESKVRELAEAHERERRFTADLAHDLRNPAAAVMAAASVFRDAEELPDSLRRFVRPLLSGARSLRILLDDLLELARSDDGHDSVELERVDLAALADDIVHGLPWEHPIRFAAEPAPITSDRRRASRILGNLVENAVTHGRDGIEVEVTREGQGATVVVRDRGPGIPPAHLEHVFDRHYTAGRTQSTGLGLSIALENARLLGGSIDARSTPGEATEFVVHLPSLSDGGAQ